MAAPSSATLSAMKEEELMNNQKQELLHSPGEGASSVLQVSSPPTAAEKKERKHPGNAISDVEIVALSPKTLMVTNRFICEVCHKGFQREQNLQLHRRGHNLPWKLKRKTSHEIRRKIYICPELDCVRHDPSKALGDLTGIKKHFSRKHGEKKFSCHKCSKKYAVRSDWKAHNKICGTKEYKCECGTTFSRGDYFISHHSVCDALAQEVARHTISTPLYSMSASLPANASNPGSISLGSPAGALNISAGNHQQLLSLSRFSGVQGFLCSTVPNNIFNLGFNSCADLNSPQNDNSFSGFLVNSEASAFNVLNSAPYNPQLSATALLQKATMTGDNSHNAALMQSIGSSLPGGMKFNSYGGALGEGMSGGGRGGGSSFQEMSNNFNVDGGSYGSTRGYGDGMEYFSDQMNALYGGFNADEMLVGQVNNNVLGEPRMNVQSEYCDKLTRDFLGMGSRMNSLSDCEIAYDHNGNGMGTNSPESEAIISAEARPFVSGCSGGFLIHHCFRRFEVGQDYA